MLDAKADIVFLVDESTSDDSGRVQEWLASIVGDLDTVLQPQVDAHYGLVGYGENNGSVHRFAHSQLVDPDDSLLTEKLFTDDVTEFEDAIDPGLADFGGDEDGWDAIEHAIAEYNFRDGAVPVFVLVQNDEGRVGFTPFSSTSANDTLTRDGILATLQSKNVILNTLTVGETNYPGSGLPDDWDPLFDLSPYGISADIRILGVEADTTDGITDGRHDYHWVDTDTFNSTSDTISATTSDALQISYNGSNTGATGMVASGKSILIGQNNGHFTPSALTA